MENLPQLILDLALILFIAGIMSIVFKRLKQPVVLGYIVAGFLAGPYMPYTQSIVDGASISTWADIGVIFLMFSLGLEFSFKKLFQIGATPFIAVASSLCCMLLVGFAVSQCFGWSRMDGVYLGGMMAIASTSIIVKAFDELGVRQQKFATLVFSVLILEDIIAIVLMLLFGTLGEGKGVDGVGLLGSLVSMAFYLVLWFLLGLYLIPLLLKHFRDILNDETLLIVSLSLCLLMVVVASFAGFSSAFGAFVMGSILAETIESEHIGRLVSPIKDLFAAIFFVSVGMMIDPAMLLLYWKPIWAITLVMLVIRSMVETFSFLLGGVGLRMAMQCGFCLAQVGEFSFIIATLGIRLGAISDFLYPIIVSVAVITTFTTPYMIRLAKPMAEWIEPRLPDRIKHLVAPRNVGSEKVHHSHQWRAWLGKMFLPVLVYGVLSIAVALLMYYYAFPFIQRWIPAGWDRRVLVLLMLSAESVFLWPLMFKNVLEESFIKLWNDPQYNRAVIFAMWLVRVLVAVLILIFSIRAFYPSLMAVGVGVLVTMGALWLFSRLYRKQIEHMESVFVGNLVSKEKQQQPDVPNYIGTLQTQDIHLADVVISPNSSCCGKSIRDLNWGRMFDVHIVAIIRNGHHLNIPSPDYRIFPDDRLQVIGNDDNLKQFIEALDKSVAEQEHSGDADMQLYQLRVGEDSTFVGARIADCGIRSEYHCLIAGVDRGAGQLLHPSPDLILLQDDVLWVVGEPGHVRSLRASLCGPVSTSS